MLSRRKYPRIPNIYLNKKEKSFKIKQTATKKILKNNNSYEETIKQLKMFIKVLKIVTENHTLDNYNIKRYINDDRLETPDLLLQAFKSALETLVNKGKIEQIIDETKNEFDNWCNKENEI